MRCNSAHRRFTSELRRLSTQWPALALRSAARRARGESGATLTAVSGVVFWLIDFTVLVGIPADTGAGKTNELSSVWLEPSAVADEKGRGHASDRQRQGSSVIKFFVFSPGKMVLVRLLCCRLAREAG